MQPFTSWNIEHPDADERCRVESSLLEVWALSLCEWALPKRRQESMAEVALGRAEAHDFVW